MKTACHIGPVVDSMQAVAFVKVKHGVWAETLLMREDDVFVEGYVASVAWMVGSTVA